MKRLRVLSLGAGVQSTTVALMAAHRDIEPPNVAIFADTGWEPAAVYAHLDWLVTQLPFPVRKVCNGNIRESLRTRRNTTGGEFAAVPWYTINPDGSDGMGRRQCSSEYKLTPIMWQIREELGVGRRERIAPGSVEVLLGISRDEAHRMRDPRQDYMTHSYPLIDLRMTRGDCVRWLDKHGYPTPPKSACIGCPFHGDDYWIHLRATSPSEWQDAVEADRELRQDEDRGEYMHRARVPLEDVRLDDRQLDLFGNECEGYCGL